MRSTKAAAISITPDPDERGLTARVRDFIAPRLKRGNPPAQIAAALRAYFDLEIDPADIVPLWRGEITLPTQTGHRQDDKESVQFPMDAETTPSLTPSAPEETPEDESAEATQTGAGPDEADSPQIPLNVAEEFGEARTHRENIQALAALARARLGIESSSAEPPKASVLTDEMKAFIVRGLARYETPSRVAASVQAEFGVQIDRRQVFAYDPAGSRPPARRWIELHAATRAQFTRAVSEIGIAQKVVRLRMLDRYANHADEANQTVRAAAFLAQAAKECGGFYERFQRSKAGAGV
jgi:hypothetical protein